MAECLFCKIITGEISAELVLENETVVAFDDISPQAPVHTLVVPKAHYRHLSDGVEDEVMSALFAAVPQVAHLKGVTDSGYRVIVNTGRDANQTVDHLHVHVIGGARMSHGMVELER